MSRGRAYLRAQRERVTAKRVRDFKLRAPWTARWVADNPDRTHDLLAPGRHANEQMALGCHRAGCQICGGYYREQRAKAEREALALEATATSSEVRR